MKLKEIIINNCLSFYGNHSIKVPDGLVLIQGKNLDNEGAITNRAGKTSLVNMISLGLYGRSPLIPKTKDFINTECESADIKLMFDEFSIHRYVKNKDYGNSIFITSNGTQKQVSQDELNLKLGSDFNAFTATTFFGTSHSDFIEKILKKPTEAKDLLSSLIPGLAIFDNAWDKVKSSISLYEKDVVETNNKIAFINGKIDGIINFDIDHRISEWETQRGDRINVIKSNLVLLKKETQNKLDIKIIRMEYEKNAEYCNSIIDKARIAYDKITNLNWGITQANKTIKDIDNENVVIKRGKCPRCNQTLPDDSKFLEINKSKKETVEIELKENTNLLNKYTVEHKKYEVEVKQLELKERDLSSKIKNYELSLKTISVIESKEKELQQIVAELNPFEKQKKELESQLREFKRELRLLNKKLEELNYYLIHLQFWHKGFGSRGIKNFIFDEIVFTLTELSKKYLNYLTNGTINVKFDPRKEKKSGGFVESIGIEVFNHSNSRDYFTWSGSERKKVSLAVDLAMNQLLMEMFGTKFQFIVFDEAFDTLDQLGIELFCKLLREQLSRFNNIFVISHNPHVEEYFDQSIYVIKENGRSKIESKNKLLRRNK